MSGISAAPASSERGFIPEDRNPVLDPSIPQLFIARIAPQSVQQGDQFFYQIIVGNSSDLEVSGAGGVFFDIPKGARYESSSAGIYSASSNTFFAAFHHFTGNPAVKFPAHSAKMITVLLTATGADGDVILDSSCNLSPKDLRQIYVPPAATLIIDGPVDSSTNQVRIAGAQLSALGIDSSVAMLDDRVAAAVGSINKYSISTRIGGTGYIQMTNGSTLVPLLGDDKILAIGPEALIGNDGSTLIGNDGSTLVAAGGGNFLGDKGKGLLFTDAATAVLNNPEALVAAGGGNLVAAGGGNLRAALSRDKSMAVSFNRNGSLTVGGGGSPPAGK